MTELSKFWNGTTVGDAASEAPYDAPTEFAKALLSLSGADKDTNKGGVWYNDLSELAPTNPSTTMVRIASGRAQVWGTWYENDANVDTTPAAPGASTRIDRYVLRKDWVAQTIRITRIAGVEGGGAPALVQIAGTTWDYPIVQASTTTGGVVTLTDQRTFLGFPPIGTAGQELRVNATAVAPEWFTRASSTQDVTTSQTTTSTSYTDLATVGPAVTLTPGITQKHLLLYGCSMVSDTVGQATLMSVAIAGAAAVDVDSALANTANTAFASRNSHHILASAVPSGSTHTTKYRVTANTGTFLNRRITGIVI